MRAVRTRGNDRERFVGRCRREGVHQIWTAGCQFRFASGWRCTPRQAAYLLAAGVERLPDGMAVIGTCAVPGCVAHVRLGTASDASHVSGQTILRRRRWTREQVIWLRSQPNLVHLPSSQRRAMLDGMMSRFPGIGRTYLAHLKSRSTWARSYADAVPGAAP